jgi:hypothetical protein
MFDLCWAGMRPGRQKAYKQDRFATWSIKSHQEPVLGMPSALRLPVIAVSNVFLLESSWSSSLMISSISSFQ